MIGFYGCLVMSTIYSRTAKTNADWLFAGGWMILAALNLFLE